ncbi:MAG: tRNA epoxyqueuosine(34) reductase QueG [Gammaproteobacteria bacterium]|nr:tRNA epoxyqueuosine(34) reductase QueG [Gammaproteobacteria bacterium]
MLRSRNPSLDIDSLAQRIKQWANGLGFQRVGITDTQLSEAETHLHHWLDQGMHGEMDYMARHGPRRSQPAQLVPGTLRIISVAMDYQPQGADPEKILADNDRGYISRYALGRDYHKLLRKRLQQLATRIETQIGPFGYRVFCDSAPVLEKALAEKAGLGWIGKHSNLLSRDGGSWFFLGELYTDLPLPTDAQTDDHCGNCRACLDACPTDAIIAPYQIDARRCISYLTIELHGPIPVALRPMLGNRIYGCDDCQLVCPWNRFAKLSAEPDFAPRHDLDDTKLVALFNWDEKEFLNRTEGSAIRRIGHLRWLRNIAVALGNGDDTTASRNALLRRREHPSELVREHVDWALKQRQPGTENQ